MSLSASFSTFINNLLYRSHPYVMVNVLASFIFLLVRLFELISVSGTVVEGSSFSSLLLQAVWIDMLTVGSVFFILSIFYFILSSLFNDRVALKVHCALLSVVILISLAVSQYFTVTLIPLGADLYGYSWKDIVLTVSASGGVNIAVLAAMAAVVAVVFVLPSVAVKLPSPKPFVLGFYLFCVLSIPLLTVVHPSPKDFRSEVGYAIVQNKLAVFGKESAAYFFRTMFGSAGSSATEYPFLHPATFDDVLGPYLVPGTTPPNIVIVAVEGLGSAFVNGGTYAGFTPFIDSLAERNLTWKNFLSTTGRTFGMLPSLTASLPFSSQGFLELGDKMPEHRSLFSLLKANGYTTSYYYGGAIDFDKQNVFLERQHVDNIIDAEDFPPPYQKESPNEQGFSWGYADGDLYKRSLEEIERGKHIPRLDVYMTLSTHEPFIPPNADRYLAMAERIITRIAVNEDQRKQLRLHRDIFSSLLYADDALRGFFAAYKQRRDYANTIFIITGDHRLIPIPIESKIDRYRVPLIIASPMVVQPKVFRSVSTHADVVPTLLGFLKQHYPMNFPSMEHWIGVPVDTAAEFRNLRARAFMPYKGEISDYINGTYFISGDRLFTLNKQLYADEIQQDSIRDRLRAEREEFIRLCNYVVERNKLMPSEKKLQAGQASSNDDSLFRVIDSWGKNSDQLFLMARDTAFHQYFEQSRVICRRLLSMNPDYHDVRTLMANTFAWQHRYGDAKTEFNEVIRRSPKYGDAYFGLARVEYWNGNFEGALKQIDRTIELLPSDPFARILKAKIRISLGQDREAMKEVEFVLKSPGSPAAAEAKELKNKFNNGTLH